MSIGIVGLSACTSSTATPLPTPTAMPTAAPSPIPTASPTPTTSIGPIPSPTTEVASRSPDGIIVLGVPTGPTHLDVHQEVTEGLTSVGPGIAYSRLLRLKSGPGVILPSLEVECDLCRRWDHPEPLTYTFHLEEGVRWHNLSPVDGRLLTAQDVAFSLERIQTPGSPGAALLNAIASVEAPDPLTVTVRLKHSDADFLVALAHGQSKVVAPEAVAVQGDLRDGPTIGTGPWVFLPKETSKLVFNSNPSYFERGLPRLERLEIQVIAAESVRLAALLNRRIDLTTLPLDEEERLQGREESIQRRVFRQPGTGLLMALKTSVPPLDQITVRQAVFHSLDPWQALAEVWQGQGEVAMGVPLASPEWSLSREELDSYFNNPARARGLLAEAGLPLPVPFTLTVADFGDRYLELGEAYKGKLESAGFEVALEVLNPRVYAEQVWGEGRFQAFLGPVPPANSPNVFLFSLVHREGVWSFTGHADPELDRRIVAQSVVEEGRAQLLRELQGYVLDKALLFMPVTGTSLWAWQRRVEGFAPNFAASEYLHWARLRVLEEVG